MADSGAKTGTKKGRKRYKPYTGGDWSIGGCQPYRAPHERSAIEAAARACEIRDHWLPIAEARAAEGRRWYPGICEVYRRELAQLDALIAADAPQKHDQAQKASAA